MTKPLVAMLALALWLAGCGLMPKYEPVQLLTLDPTEVPRLGRSDACFWDIAEGPLTADPTYGTAITLGDLTGDHQRVPVAWLPGFTGRRVGSEVEVLDAQGNVILITGHNYKIAGGGVGPEYWPGLEVLPWAWFACTTGPNTRPLPQSQATDP